MNKYLGLIFLLLFSISVIAQSDELKNALIGIESEDKEVVKTSLSYILKHESEIPATHLFMASAQSLRINQLEIAGYLYYAAQLRAKYDLYRFPPLQKGGDSPGITLAKMKDQVGLVVTPELFKKPEIYTRVITNLTKFNINTSSGYDPGWDYTSVASIEKQKQILFRIANTDIKQLSDFSKLLNDKDYFSAFRIVQNYNELAEDLKLLQTYINEKEAAEKTMQDIETKMNIIGMYYKGLPD